MTGILDLEELIRHIRSAWPNRYERGRILHVHRNAMKTDGGASIHLRIMVQQISDAEAETHHADQEGLS